MTDSEFQALVDLTDRLFAKLDAESFEGLSEAEQTVLVVWEFEAEMNNGGFDPYLHNTAGGRAFALLGALRRIGAEAVAVPTARILAAFGAGGPPRDQEARWNALQELERAGARSEAIDAAATREFDDVSASLSDLLIDYARREGLVEP